MSTPTDKTTRNPSRLSKEAQDARRPTPPAVLADALPEDCAACDEHGEVYPIGGSCPECDLVEARELAAEWLRLDPCDDSCGKKCIAADNRKRLFAWVREWMDSSAWNDDAGLLSKCKDDLGATLEVSRLNVDALLLAAGWPS